MTDSAASIILYNPRAASPGHQRLPLSLLLFSDSTTAAGRGKAKIPSPPLGRRRGYGPVALGVGFLSKAMTGRTQWAQSLYGLPTASVCKVSWIVRPAKGERSTA